MRTFRTLPLLLALGAALALPAQAGAIRHAAAFNQALGANDDGSSDREALGFQINFFGQSLSSLWVNNNGNVTFDGALDTYNPFPLLNSGRQILAPFFADVDTGGQGSGVVQFGQAMIDGRRAFGVNWIGVGYFNAQTDRLNSFQLIITDRSDIAAGDFDFEFNYDRIEWEAGDASGGVGGLGGDSARMGWSNGVDASYEQAGSAVNGAFVDGGPFALAGGSLGSGVAGRYLFNVRNGQVEVPRQLPEPATWALAACALLGAGAARRRCAPGAR